MKITTVFILMICLHASAATFSQKVSLKARNISLSEAFSKLESQSGYFFIWPKEVLKNMAPVNADINDMSLSAALDVLLTGHPLDYTFEGKLIIIRRKDAILSVEDAVFIPITGVVRTSTGEPLAGASVRIKGGDKGVYTDEAGRFSLQADKGQTLVISFTGYKTKEVRAENATVIAVTMELQDVAMDEVVVGYGSVKKKDMNGAVSQINVAEMQKQGAFNFDVALAGRAAGVQVVKSSGAPGAEASIRVRGSASLNGLNEPLYVIDGVPIQIGQGQGNTQEYRNNKTYQPSPLAMINPQDIESIDILKDASGTAIYGSRGANGVILVTTKKGKKGQQPTVNVGYNATFDSFYKETEPLTSEELLKVATDAYKNNLQTIPANFITYPGVNTNWKDLVTRNSYSGAWNINLRGGTQNGGTIYSISASTNKQRGVLRGSDIKRYSIVSNIESQVIKMLKLGANFNYANNTSNGLGSTYYYNVIGYRPDVPVFDANGRYASTLDSSSANPVAKLNQINHAVNKGLITSGYAELSPFEFLKIRSTIQYNSNDNITYNYIPSTDPLEFRGRRRGTRRDVSYLFSSVVFDNTITFNKSFGKHDINAVAGSSFTSDESDNLTIGSQNFPDDITMTNLGSAGLITQYQSGATKSGLESYLARANYNYDNRYYFTFTSRNDKSTKFGPNNQWGFFPSGAIAWRVSNEKFLNGSSWLSDLKIRASYGKTGVANLPDFEYASFFGTADYNESFYNGQLGLVLTGAPNPSLKWETILQSDFGIDFAFFNNRLRGTIDIYHKSSKDVLQSINIPFETGKSTQTLNIADLTNRGVEFAIGGDVVKTRNFTFSSDINLSFNRSRLDKLNGGINNVLKEGDRLGVIAGYRTAGLFQTKEEVTALNLKSPSGFYQTAKTSAGDLKFVDMNNDGFISIADQTNLGTAEPDFFGGWNNIIRYKGFEASFLFYFSYGQLLQNSLKKSRGIYNGDINYSRSVLDAWTPENTNTNMPRNVKTDPNQNGRTSDYFIQDGSFFKLKNLQIAYNFNPKRITSNQISRISLFAAASNVFILTGYDGFDPELSVSGNNGLIPGGNDLGIYPSTRTFSAGINITL